jgi:ADP-ribose pyrophosphatase
MRHSGLRRNLRSIYKGKIIQLNLEPVRLPNGHVTELEIVHHPGASAVVPFLDRDHVILIRQYRHATGKYLYEIPAGKLMKHESPLSCARRELEEEIGYRARQFKKLISAYTSPGFCNELIHIYMATDLSKTQQSLESCEVLKVIKLPVHKVQAMICSGKIQDAKSIIGLQLACQRIN